jgi:hypothetical protein
MQIGVILSQIDLGSMALPEFQRGYVWNRDQVRGLMEALYRKHPVGGLLVWLTKSEEANARGDASLAPGIVKLLLDGQQRITSLYGIIRGKPPKFFDGNAQTFTGLYFNLKEETFEFYAPLKMKDNPLWFSVTDLMREGVAEGVKRVLASPDLAADVNQYINRLNAIENIKQIDLHIEEVTGEDKTVDVVVGIFNRVNSGGTKLSQGDLALAKICAEWPPAREEMKKRLSKWTNAGFDFDLDWLLRNINAILRNESRFDAMKNVTTSEFREGLEAAERTTDTLLNLIASRLGLDHGDVLGSRYALPVMARYLAQKNYKVADHKERDKLLYWYIQTLLWGRYAGSVESTMRQDLTQLDPLNTALEKLIGLLRQTRGDLRLRPDDFFGWSRGARFYPLLYMLTRVCKAKDWETGVELSSYLLGHLQTLQVHHIFPKKVLYNRGYDRPQVNAIANFTFLTQSANLWVTDRDPEEYFLEVEKRHPGALESHWIPMDERLWKTENYLDFLAARRELLAQTANQFLDTLLTGGIPEEKSAVSILDKPAPLVADVEEEEKLLAELNQWVIDQGLPAGALNHQLPDQSGREFEILDLAWPDGLQLNLSQAVAVLPDGRSRAPEAAAQAGFRVFTSINNFKSYVTREILAM